MPRTRTAQPKPGGVSPSLAKDRLGVPAVLFFVLAGVAPLTVAAGVIPTAYATTGLTGIPAAFVVIAVILAIFASGYVTMARHIRNAGACYAFISHGLGRTLGIPAALVALLAYSMLQIGLYGALGPAAAASGHLPARPCPVVGVGARRVGHHHHPRRAARGHHRPGPGRAAVRRACGDRRGDRAGAGPPGGRAPQLRYPLALGADLGRVRHLRGAGRDRRPRLRRLRAGPRPGRGSTQHPPDDPGGHLHRARRDRGHLRRGVLGHGRPHRHQRRRVRGREARPWVAVRPRRQQRAGPTGAGAVHHLAVRRRAVVPQRHLAVRVRSRPGERAARRAGPHRGQQHPQSRVPGPKRHRRGGDRHLRGDRAGPDDQDVLLAGHHRRVRRPVAADRDRRGDRGVLRP